VPGAGAVTPHRHPLHLFFNALRTNAWVRLTNSLSLSNGLLRLEEPTAAGLPRRFYRVMER